MDLPLNPSARAPHPQTLIPSIYYVLKSENSYLTKAFEFFNLGPYSMRRNKDSVATYKSVHDKFKELGLLKDLDLDNRYISVDYVRLCLARAEQYREEHNLWNDGSHKKKFIMIDELPLGPLSHIKYMRNFALERFISVKERNIPQCMICLLEITRGETTMLTCACRASICRSCAQQSIGGQPGTFHDVPPGLTCPFCRMVSYCTVQDVTVAAEREASLIRRAFTRFEIGKGTKRNQTLCVVLMLEAEKLGLHYHTNFTVEHADKHQINLEIARLQVTTMTCLILRLM